MVAKFWRDYYLTYLNIAEGKLRSTPLVQKVSLASDYFGSQAFLWTRALAIAAAAARASCPAEGAIAAPPLPLGSVRWQILDSTPGYMVRRHLGPPGVGLIWLPAQTHRPRRRASIVPMATQTS